MESKDKNNIEKGFSPEKIEKSFETRKESIKEYKDIEARVAEKEKKIPNPVLTKKNNAKELEQNDKISPILSKKMQYFLDIAEEKGLSFAIEEIEKENDALLLDSFHDALVKEKLFEQILKKKPASAKGYGEAKK